MFARFFVQLILNVARKVCSNENVCHFGWQLSFQGEPGSAIVLPKCGPGEYITSDGKQLTCVKFGMLCNTCNNAFWSSCLLSNGDDAVS